MAIRVIETRIGCPPTATWYVFDDRRHTYLDADGRWQVVPAYFPSAQEALEALRVRSQQDACAIR